MILETTVAVKLIRPEKRRVIRGMLARFEREVAVLHGEAFALEFLDITTYGRTADWDVSTKCGSLPAGATTAERSSKATVFITAGPGRSFTCSIKSVRR